jgi:adenylosuccinate synthase
MSNASIVLGMGFGDEGKGLTTDFLCLQRPSFSKVVVRFSGGQQAGHNVKINGVSHVHSNFGSGTLRGLPSYFTEHCTVYPTTILRETIALKGKGVNPDLAIHPLAKITTPFDVAWNRLTEKSLKHGSCGLGISATMKRNLETGYKLFGVDLTNYPILKIKLANIFDYYLSRVHPDDVKTYKELVREEISDFYKSLDMIKFNVKGYDYLLQFHDIIFEGSQGILLDMNHGIFPNVTFANTTSKNALEVCNTLKIRDVEIYYITRCYQTRHGNGWMSNNDPITLINNEDEINVFNEWQTNFKIGELDYELLKYSLNVDSAYSPGIRKNLVVTCLDQRPDFKFNKEFIDYTLGGNLYYNNSAESGNMTWQEKI